MQRPETSQQKGHEKVTERSQRVHKEILAERSGQRQQKIQQKRHRDWVREEEREFEMTDSHAGGVEALIS